MNYLKTKLSLTQFKALSDNEKRDYMANAEPSQKEQFIKDMLNYAPTLLLPYSKWIDWNNREKLDILENKNVIEVLVKKDILTQESIDYKFIVTTKLSVIKYLFDEVSLTSYRKSAVVVAHYKNNGDSVQHILTFITQLINDNKFDWDYANDSRSSFQEMLGNIFANSDNYMTFCKFIISQDKFEVNADIENACFYSKKPLIQLLLVKPGYKIKNTPNRFLDTGKIHEVFSQWTKKEISDFKVAVHTHVELVEWIMENEYEELYPSTVTDIFLF